jgi:hypothetical protein
MAGIATASKTAARVMRNRNANYGTQIDQLGGIQVGTSIVLVNLETDRRFHNIRFQVTAVYATGGTALTATALTGIGTGLKVDVTVNATGIVTGIVFNAGNAGANFVTGNQITYTDPTGAGFVGTVTAGIGGDVTAIAITSQGTPVAAPVGAVLGIVQLLVNGSPVGDLTAQQEINRALFNNEPISLGQFPIFFTEPWRNFTRRPSVTSWDMAGQQTFAIKMAIQPGWSTVGVVGVYEYDYIRNTVQGEIDAATYQAALAAGTAPAPMLQIIARHAFTPTLNAGQNILTGQQVPILPWPILRMHLSGGTAGQLTQSILLEDGQTIESGFIGTVGGQLDQLVEALVERGFDTTIFDYSYVSDKGQRIQDCLKFAAALKWSLYSNIAMGLTIVQERLQNRYE